MEACAGPCPGHSSGLAGAVFGNLVQTLLAAQCALGNPADYPRDAGTDVLDVYDFVIVGGGTAGSVLAHRLTENLDWTVLLVESGGDPSFTSEVPGLLFNLQHTEIDWKYKTEPQENSCRGMLEDRCNWPRGRVLGGSSTINAMIYVRGNKQDYDRWKSAGNPGWGYDDVLPYFKKSEDSALENKKYHSSGGPLTVQYHNNSLPLKQILIDAAKELGYKHLEDVNIDEPIGYGVAPGTIRRGTRCSTAKAFLTPIKDRSNLHVVKFGLVTKIHIDRNTNTAYGIQYIKGGEIKDIRASKEVILSAGVVNSPQLLMLSGVGPKEHLEKMGISPIKALPVGNNLQDHVTFLGTIFSINKSNPKPIPPIVLLDSLYQYLTRNSGQLASIGITDLVGFINTKQPPEKTTYPNLQFHHIAIPVNDTIILNGLISAVDFMPDLSRFLHEENTKSDLLWILPTLLHPRSTGKIELSTSDPLEYPKIHPGYLSDAEDIDTLLDSIEFVKKLGETKALQDMEAEMLHIKYKACESLQFDTEEYWRCAIKHMTTTLYHPVGTCKMGLAADSAAVVSAELKVHGVERLRVVDAAVMPTIPSANTNAAVVMIAEKAADMVKQEWKRKDEL